MRARKNAGRPRGLAGIGARKDFELALVQTRTAAQRQRSPFSLLLVEIDFFQQFGAVSGLSASDECLDRVVETLVDTARRPGAQTFVYGSGRFGMMLPGVAAHEAERIGEEIRFQSESLVITNPRSPVSRNITVSVGIATWQPEEPVMGARLLADAESALARAKSLGRNQVVHAALTLAFN